MHRIAKIKPVKNLTELAYESIKNYVLREDLDESTKLTEELLSGQLGISKSPVREALNSLATEGLVRIEPRRGAYLRQFSQKEVLDLYNLREALEVYAVSIAHITPALLAEMRKSIQHTEKLLKAHDRQGHIEEDMHFHGLIASAAGNAELGRILLNIQNQIWLCRRKTYDLSSSTSPDAHRAILAAFEKGDLKSAQTAMHKHITLVRDRLLAFMESKNSASAS